MPSDREAVKPSATELLVKARAQIRRLKKKIAAYEAILVCDNCEHLRSEHHEADSPCYGGRTPDMSPDEGKYCDCAGFTSSEKIG